jgi:hypothetical protein
MLIKGEGGAEDLPLARKYLKMAAHNGNVTAMIKFGYMLYDGVGGAVDEMGAKQYFARAAYEGNEKALEILRDSKFEEAITPNDQVVGQESQSNVNRIIGDPSAAVNATEEELQNYQSFLNILESYRGSIGEEAFLRARNLIKDLEELHRNNLMYCLEIYFNKDEPGMNLGQSQMRRTIYLHPEQSDMRIELRASHFYNMLKLAFDRINGLDQEQRKEVFMYFFGNGFYDGLCLEGRVATMSDKLFEIFKRIDNLKDGKLPWNAESEVFHHARHFMKTAQNEEELIGLVFNEVNGKTGSDGIQIDRVFVTDAIKILGLF